MYIYGGYQDLRGSTTELWAFHFGKKNLTYYLFTYYLFTYLPITYLPITYYLFTYKILPITYLKYYLEVLSSKYGTLWTYKRAKIVDFVLLFISLMFKY